jgi:hypothetical protein
LFRNQENQIPKHPTLRQPTHQRFQAQDRGI